tara:strand:+ start:5177 stop:5329 length:153 start_codon:yes stop_codon:yes gene_type:complete
MYNFILCPFIGSYYYQTNKWMDSPEAVREKPNGNDRKGISKRIGTDETIK